MAFTFLGYIYSGTPCTCKKMQPQEECGEVFDNIEEPPSKNFAFAMLNASKVPCD